MVLVFKKNGGLIMNNLQLMKSNDRRAIHNLHTISELEQDNNRLISLDDTKGILRMRRGNTITTYSKVDIYWKPINAKTV